MFNKNIFFLNMMIKLLDFNIKISTPLLFYTGMLIIKNNIQTRS